MTLPHFWGHYPSLVFRFGGRRRRPGLCSTTQMWFLEQCKALTLTKENIPFSLVLFASSQPPHPSPQPSLVLSAVNPQAYSGNSCRMVCTVSQEALLLLSTSLRTPAKDPAQLLSKTDKLRGLELRFRNSKWGTLDTILLT